MTFSNLPCLIADEVFKNFQKIQIQFVKRKNRMKINFFLFVNKVIRNEPRFFPSFIFLLFFNHGANLGYMVSLGLIFLNDPYFGRLISIFSEFLSLPFLNFIVDIKLTKIQIEN